MPRFSREEMALELFHKIWQWGSQAETCFDDEIHLKIFNHMIMICIELQW